MNIFKLLLVLAVLLLAAFGAFALLGLIFASLKYILLLGLIVLIGAVGYRALTKKSDEPLIEEGWPEKELAEARRVLDSVRRRQLTK